MTESGLSLVGEYTPLGVSISFNLFFIIMYVKGLLVSRSHYMDQVKISDSWQQAYEKSEDTKRDQGELLKKLIVVSDTMERVLNAFPVNNAAPNHSVENGGGDSA
jgi:hypothetical protein